MRRSSRRPVCASRASARPEVGIERAFVKFVEQHGGDAGQFGIVEDLPRENALGDDLDPRRARNLRAEADAVADGLAGALAERPRHPFGAGAGRDPPRLQHDDLLAVQPGRIEQRQRHPRGLAGAGRRHQDGGVVGRERAPEFIEHRVDRKWGVEAAGQWRLASMRSSPLPLWERVDRRRASGGETGEGSVSADGDPSSDADCVRATFSHKGRREESLTATPVPRCRT